MAEQTEDLKAFERRLTEVIDKLQPAARAWRMLLIVISILTAVGAWAWLWDPRTSQVHPNVTFTQSLLYHPVFAISCFTLLLLFLSGIHKRVVAPSIIASRCRFVLAEYNMSCDDTGKLILKPRPST
ncbi:nuclear envelope phosphatase-regulatory subunit 1-like isoform X1 [Littorina saxatilis]|uniref:Transmembrane protein 188 n=1 Tax=Littorina saxatilis TaxID=31220 RepID=A0AAN9BZ64_9CAEN